MMGKNNSSGLKETVEHHTNLSSGDILASKRCFQSWKEAIKMLRDFKAISGESFV